MPPERRRPASLIAAAPARLRELGRFWTRREALPLALLLLALAAVFLFSNDRGHFYRDTRHHDWITSQHLTQAVNLSPRHYFLLFVARTLDAEGDIAYVTYARWPIGSYALVKVATLPFGDNLAAGIYAARIVMLLLFAGAATLAYLALARLCGDGWVALTATLLAFSSYYCLYYNDAFAPDAVPGLFGALLAFHGMVIFEQEGRFRQLLLKSCAGLLLCWQAYALLLPYIVFALAREAFRARGAASASPVLGQLKRAGAALLSSHYLKLGVVTLCFGIAVLGFNVVNEYFAFDQERPLTQLPTLKRAAYRYSGEPGNSYPVSSGNYGAFLQQQFYRIGQMTQPYFMNPFDTNPFDSSEDYLPQDYLGLIAGALALAVGVVGLIFVRYKALLAAALLSGFVWLLPLWNWSAAHDFQALFYIGIPLAAFALIMLYLRQRLGPRLAAVFVVAAIAAFVLSAAEMAGVGNNKAAAAAEREAMQDFAVIRNLVADTDGVVYVEATPTHRELFGGEVAAGYFLAGKVIMDGPPIPYLFLAGDIPDRLAWADYVVTPRRESGPALLTPNNRRVFLYDRVIYAAQHNTVHLGSPIIAAAAWKVYSKYNSLIYVSDQCANTDAAFFLHLFPRDISDLPEGRKKHGFENRDFFFADYDIGRRDARCIAVRELPKYEVAAISTGQYTAAGRLWQAEYRFE